MSRYQFPITDAAIREMERRERMQLKNARATVRKGDTLGGRPSDTAAQDLRAMAATVDIEDPLGPTFVVGGSIGENMGFNQTLYNSFPTTFVIEGDVDPTTTWEASTGKFKAPYEGLYRFEGIISYIFEPIIASDPDHTDIHEFSLAINHQGDKVYVDQTSWIDEAGTLDWTFRLGGGADLYMTQGMQVRLQVWALFGIGGTGSRIPGVENTRFSARYLGALAA